MYFAIFTLVTALSISVIAAWYSIIGLTAIFASAFIPIVIMGGSLEVGKVVTAVWLHKNWDRAQLWIRAYLSTATIILMFITSMGIFGFLSKAHIEQTSAGEENIAKIEQYSKELIRQNAIVDRSTNKINALENASAKTDSTIQAQIDKEQERIDSAHVRIKPTIAEQNMIIADQTRLYSGQIDTIDKKIQILQDHIDSGRYAKAQIMIGASGDGRWREKSVKASNEWKINKAEERNILVSKVEKIARNNSTIKSARKEIRRLRDKTDVEIAQSNKLIDRLRAKIGNTKVLNISAQVEQHNNKITQANVKIEDLTSIKFKIESEYRKLEAEVGPIKYIAEFIYGEEANRDMLERAVRWVILMLIFVFDPLAICLILAGAQQLAWERKKLEDADGIEIDYDDIDYDDIDYDEPDVQTYDDAPLAEYEAGLDEGEADTYDVGEDIGQPVDAKFEIVEDLDEPVLDEPEPLVTSVSAAITLAEPAPVQNAEVDMSPIVSSIEQLQSMLANMNQETELSPEEILEKEQIVQLLRRQSVTNRLRSPKKEE